MVLMDDAALEAKGVAALGARRKMLKTFEEVRSQMGIPEPGADKTQAPAATEDEPVKPKPAAEGEKSAEEGQ